MLFVADFGNRSRFYTKTIRQYMTDEYCYHRLYNARSYFFAIVFVVISLLRLSVLPEIPKIFDICKYSDNYLYFGLVK